MLTKFWRAAAAAAAAVALAAAPVAAFADDPKPKPVDKKPAGKSVAEKLADIRNDPAVKDALQRAMDAQKEMQKAKDDEKPTKEKAFEAAVEAYKTAMAATAPQYVALAKAAPTDPAVLDVVMAALQIGGGKFAKDLTPIVVDRVKDSKLPNVLMALSRNSSLEVTDLLKAVAAAATDKAVKGQTALATGLQLKSQISGYDVKPTPEQIAKVMPEAEKYLAMAEKDYADVPFGPKQANQMVGAMAKRELIGLKNVPNLQVGKPAPEAACNDLDGKACKLSDLKGKVVVLDIWATWCPPCRAMIPHERDMVKHLEGKPFALVSVSADAKKETLTAFIDKEKMPWTHWWNGADGGVLAEWNVQAFPTIYVIDAKGVIRYKNVREKELEEAVGKLVKEAEESKAPANE